VGVLDEILAWSSGRPLWQRDALRRLVVRTRLEPSDIDELVDLAKHDDKGALPVRPITAQDVAVAPTPGLPVTIRAISQVTNVNALADGQTLPFDQKGLTVVYGDNGAGKSGYVRILRKVCRARARDEEILPNVFAEDAGAPGETSACISYGHGAAEEVTKWVDGVAGPDALSLVNVFDSACAAVYVTGTQDIAYVPFGLDLLTRLAETCGVIRSRLEGEANSDSKKLSAPPSGIAETPTGRWIRSLGEKTSSEEVEARTNFDSAASGRKTAIEKALVTDNPLKQADELRVRLRRYKKVQETLEKAVELLSADRVEELEKVHAALKIAVASKRLALAASSGASVMEGVGAPAWERMWEAAEEFHLLHSQDPLSSAERCPLCQQLLGADASERFRLFAEYFLSKASQDESSLRDQLRLALEHIGALDLGENLNDTLDELRAQAPDIADQVASFISAIRPVQVAVSEFAEEGDVITLAPAPVLDLGSLTTHVGELAQLIGDLEARADQKELQELRDELEELNARSWASGMRPQVREEVARLARESLRDSALTKTSTNAITMKAHELTEKYVTDQLRERFKQELDTITGRSLRVRLIAEAERGSGYFRLQLFHDNYPISTPLSRVASEGELRAISLAAFLSEVSDETTKSCLVFDDPVSSLDLPNRERIALRVVEIAAGRQVIVFTHDLFFLIHLRDLAQRLNVDCQTYSVVRRLDESGVFHDDVPWEAKSLSSQVGALRKACQQLQGEGKSLTIGEFNSRVERICKDLRKAIETAIEEVLLGGIVGRYQRAIHSGPLLKLKAIESSDLQLLDKLMSRYSVYEHAQSTASAAAFPDLSEVGADVESLDAWRRDYGKRFDGK